MIDNRRIAPFYVYILKGVDGKPFYVGKGSGARALHHIFSSDPAGGERKIDMIRRIREARAPVSVEIVGWFDAASDAFRRERELVATYGTLDEQTGPLCNKVKTRSKRQTRTGHVSLNVRISTDLKRRLDRIAVEDRRTLSSTVTELLAGMLPPATLPAS